MRLTFYKGQHLSEYQHLPGLRKFGAYFDIYGREVTPIDRTNVLKLPVSTKSLFPLPKMREFTKSYEDVCNKRAQELLKRADKLDTRLFALWSGGVDSTCLLVSLLKNATPAQKERIVVLLSEDSIIEYPAFYYAYIRGKLRRESATMFPHVLGTKNLIVNGEHNDQLFGSDIIAEVINRFGFEAVREPYERKLLGCFFDEKMRGDTDTALLYLTLFERLRESAPIPLKTNYDVFWWINFATKWQCVYMRMLSFVADRNAGNLSEQYLQDYYAPFYNTEAFQLWSMNNVEQRVRDSWRSYKWPAKKVIYEFTKDMDYYQNKTKRGSLQFLIPQHVQRKFIDENFVCYDELEPESFYEKENDFV